MYSQARWFCQNDSFEKWSGYWSSKMGIWWVGYSDARVLVHNSLNFYTPDIRSMWGYIVFAFPFVSSFVGTYFRSSFRHRVKVFALKFIRPHILKTLWWISFIFGMMVDIGLKFLSTPSPPRGWPWGQGHGLGIFVKKSKFFVFKFI